jgi:hypothetical protein
MPGARIRIAVSRALAASIVLVIVGGLIGWVAPPAAAAVGVDLKASSGAVGVSQNVTATVSSSAIGSPTGKVTLTADGTVIGSKAVGGDQGATASFAWAPSSAGAVVLRATFDADSGERATDQLTVQVNVIATTTALSVPAAASAAAKVSLTATVAAKSGTYVPTGTVAFRLNNGTALGTATLGSDAKATLSFTTPSSATTLTIVAAYAGDGRAAASTSGNASLKISTTDSKVTLTLPANARVGTGTELMARITPATATGNVTFAANGTAIGSAKVTNGSARLPWTPTAAGSVTIVATYPGATGVGPGSATGRVHVAPALTPDTITVTPAGSTTPWSTSTSIALPNGSQVEIVAASTSRLPVTLAVVGPCALSASTLVVKGVGGSCLLTASTKGDGTYAPASQRYTIGTGVGRQIAALAAPSSRSVPRHSSLRLSRIKATTNIGQPITWRVTTGKARCHIKRTAATYRVVLSRKGICRVRATAPGIPGQWAPFSTFRTYRIR